MSSAPPRAGGPIVQHLNIPLLDNMATNADETPASCKVVLAGTIAETILQEVHESLANLPKPPLLVGFLANADPAARMYADWTAKTCKEK